MWASERAKDTDPYLVVTQIKIDPNDCDFGAPLTFELTFDALRPLQNVQWRFSYARDIVGVPDDVIGLQRVDRGEYAGAGNRVDCYAQLVAAPAPNQHANVGVVRCALHEGGGAEGGAELHRLDLVCQVTADETTGELRRVIHSPLGD
jgi:hypothetical protein